MIHKILIELNKENGTNYKIEVLKKYKSNELLKRVLKMTYDKVSYTYGISMKNIKYNANKNKAKITLEEALDILENQFLTRKITGNDAIKSLTNLLQSLNFKDADILTKIINRDLKINMGRTNINKVFKNLIVKPVYMRCGIFTKDSINSKNGTIQKGTYRNINFDKAFIQLKADGTYREVTVENGCVTFNSRSGEIYQYPKLKEFFSTLPDGKYIGELTIKGISNRAEANGLINSDEIPHEKLLFEVWDYVTLIEYSKAANKDKETSKYKDRYNKLVSIISKVETTNIKVIETYIINNLEEALSYVSKWMKDGLEGGILKDKDGIFRDGTSKHQLKLKLQIDGEFRITGFTQGKKGTIRENTFGAITFSNDEGTVKGQTSGFTDAQLNDFNNRRSELIGKIITVQFNDISKSEKNEYYALSHPRFIELRNDKDETDTLEKLKELKRMAMSL